MSKPDATTSPMAMPGIWCRLGFALLVFAGCCGAAGVCAAAVLSLVCCVWGFDGEGTALAVAVGAGSEACG